MASLGNVLNPANNFIFKRSGDGSTKDFTIAENPASDQSCLVFVGGMLQDVGSHVVRAGKTFTFTIAPPKGVNNILIYVIGQRLDLPTVTSGAISTEKLADRSVEAAKQAPGVLINSARKDIPEYVEYGVPAGFGFDNTIPQITEGAEIATLKYTPLLPNSKIEITTKAFVVSASAQHCATGIFIVGDTDAKSVAAHTIADIHWSNTFNDGYEFTVANGDEIEVMLRVSGTGSVAIYLNGRAGVQLYGALPKTFISIKEYRQ